MSPTFLSICDPTKYSKPPLDVPTFYQRLSRDPRLNFCHIPVSNVFRAARTLPKIEVATSAGTLPYDAFVALGKRASEVKHLANIDLVFCRTLKPFPPGYLDELSRWEQWTRFVNCPKTKKEQIRPDFLVKVARDFIPDALVTSNWQEAQAFFERHQVIVAKQVNSCGGRGVYKIWYEQGQFHVDNLLAGPQTFATFAQLMGHLQQASHPLQLHRYLHRVHAGDKRVVVVDGEIYGSYLRRSKGGHWVNNVSGDGECTLAEITADEISAIEHTVEAYRRRGLHTLGYDFLMDDDGSWRISEINAGNIGGFARLELLTGRPVMNRLIDWMIAFSQRPIASGDATALPEAS
ncbi:MAG: RimK family alpha-L-glutamate ligase [Elainellaceae cyanobacterium]